MSNLIHVNHQSGITASRYRSCLRIRWHWVLLIVLACSACSQEQGLPTRTPFPTWTSTPAGGAVPNPPAAEAPVTAPDQQAPTEAPSVAVADPPTETPVPAEPTPLPTDTPPPTDTPVPLPTDTPTATPEPTATPTPAFLFTLESAEKFPTTSLATNVVRIYLYVYSDEALGLADYSLQVAHDGTPLIVDELSAAGAPGVTRTEPSPYTRFTNLDVVFAENQAGRWEIQLIDANRTPVGPPAIFDLTADELTRELYVRYRED